MRYKLSCGIEIRTENAAKPEAQRSKFLSTLIAKLPHVDTTFDYGCGKLRYQSIIADTTDMLAVVDSEIQVSRLQVLRGKETSIRNIFRQSNRIQVFNDVEFHEAGTHFDRGFCINVLSVIPSFARRRRALSLIRQRLKPGGECLFAVQYRNSDFTRMRQMPNARRWLDGFIVDSLRGHSFYGMIQPKRLEKILERAGFRVRETILNDGSVYVWVIPG